MFSNAESVGADTVNGPGSFKVSTRLAASREVIKVEKEPLPQLIYK